MGDGTRQLRPDELAEWDARVRESVVKANARGSIGFRGVYLKGLYVPLDGFTPGRRGRYGTSWQKWRER